MIKTLARGAGGCGNVMRYLERDGRARSFDASDCSLEQGLWAQDFDALRRRNGKDDGRKYYHVVISPDPLDRLDVQQVRELALAWVEQAHPDAQWVCYVHDDNGLPHAHVVMNAVLADGTRKLHLSREDELRDAEALQDLCRERGYSALPSLREVEQARRAAIDPAARVRAETRRRDARRRARAAGAHLWTDDMRSAVEQALERCHSWTQFERNLAARGYEARVNRRGVLTIYPSERTDSDPDAPKPCKGYKLDSTYTVEGIRARLRVCVDRRLAEREGDGTPTLDAAHLPRDLPACAEERLRRAAEAGRPQGTLQALVDAATLCRRLGCRTIEDLEAAGARLADEACEARAEERAAIVVSEQLLTCIEKAQARDVLLAHVGSMPDEPVEARVWQEKNSRDLKLVRDARGWLSARGVSPDVDLDELRRMLSREEDAAASSAARADSLASASETVEAAAAELRTGGLAGRGRSTARARDAFAPPARALDVMKDPDQWAAFCSRHRSDPRRASAACARGRRREEETVQLGLTRRRVLVVRARVMRIRAAARSETGPEAEIRRVEQSNTARAEARRETRR